MQNNEGLRINTIITLDNSEKYVVLNKTMYGGINYFLVMGVNEQNDVIPSKVAILEEIIDNNELRVAKVEDQDLIITLTRILKSQM